MASSSVDEPHSLVSAQSHIILPVNRRLTFEAETLLYTLSEVNIARGVEQELTTDQGSECERQKLDSLSGLPYPTTGGGRHPPDGGYGWVVTFGSFMSHMVEGAIERGEAIFYVHFKDRFGKSHQMTTLPSAMSSTLRFMLSPLASMLCNSYSIRASVLLGACVFTTGMFLTQFANNFWLLFLTYGVMAGCGRAFFSGPGLIIIGLYFRQRQGVASGVAASGVGFGSFLLVPLVEFLFHHYDFSGAFLVLSAISSHMVLVAMLYRPLSTNERYLALDAKKKLEKTSQIELSGGVTSASLPLDHRQESVQKFTGTERSVTDLVSTQNKNQNFNIEQPRSSSSSVKPASPPRPGKCRRLLCENCCCQICFPVEVFNQSGQDSDSQIFQCHLLKKHSFSFYCLTVFLFTISFKIYYTFFLTLMVDKGYTTRDGTLVIASVGPLDTMSRIGIGLLVDLKSVQPYRMRLFNLLLACMAVCALVVPGVSDMTQIWAIMAVYSMCSGMCFATRTVVLVDLLGVRRLCSAFGILMFFQGFATIIGPPFAGMLIDVYNTITYVYYMSSASMALSAIFMSMSIYCHAHTKNIE